MNLKEFKFFKQFFSAWEFRKNRGACILMKIEWNDVTSFQIYSYYVLWNDKKSTEITKNKENETVFRR